MSTPNRDLLRGWLDPKEWWRLGRGRTFDFALSRRDVIAAIHHLGASDGHDFDVVACGSEKPPGERFYRSTHRVISVDELLAEPATNQFLRSRRLTPALPKIEPGWDWRWDAACSLNGLVGITYSVSRKSPSLKPGLASCTASSIEQPEKWSSTSSTTASSTGSRHGYAKQCRLRPTCRHTTDWAPVPNQGEIRLNLLATSSPTPSSRFTRERSLVRNQPRPSP